MKKGLGRNISLIIFIFILSIFISLPKELPIKLNFGPINIDQKLVRNDINLSIGNFKIQKDLDLKLGLDLVGGAHLTFEADTQGIPVEKQQDAIKALRGVIERRVNLYGVSEPNIQTASYENKNKIIVDLPGITDTAEAVNLIGQTAQLNFAELITTEAETEGAEEQSPELKITQLSGAHLRDAQVVFDQVSGQPAVSLTFNSEGSELFAQITERNVGNQVPILLDGEILSAPVVQEKIIGGSAQISGNFTVEEAKELAIKLNAGALPIPIKLIEEQTTGATLGEESIAKSVQAGVVGLIIVCIFMVIFYGRLGLVADLALLSFGAITLTLYKLIPVVLTLPGIAGFLLSVGMAVDSNILIFERFREEKRKGVENNLYALETSFGKAWDSIRDANIATLATAFILANPFNWSFLHVSGPVRGFAITLALGVAVSMFTGVFVSRNLLRFFTKA